MHVVQWIVLLDGFYTLKTLSLYLIAFIFGNLKKQCNICKKFCTIGHIIIPFNALTTGQEIDFPILPSMTQSNLTTLPFLEPFSVGKQTQEIGG